VRTHLASLVEEFRQHAAETAVVAHRGNRRYATTYDELAQLSGRFANELERRNIAAGERVVLWGENSAEWIGAFFGCLLRGVIAVPLDAAGSVEFASRVIHDVSARLIVGDRRLLASLSTKVPQMRLPELAAELPAQPQFAVSAAVNEQTPFQIIFTSGTTSEPKGIVHTHRNVLASLQPIEDEIAKYRKHERWVHPLRFLHTLPLSHVFGQFMGLWVPSLLAAELHFSDQFEPARTVELIRRESISVLVAVPRVLQMLRTHLLRQFSSLAKGLESSHSLSIWKRWWHFRQVHHALGWKFWAVISGGSSMPTELEGFWNQLGLALIQGYGLTETAALVTLNHPFHISRGTIGKALPGREVRISEESEILVRGDMLAQATWQVGAMRPRESEWLSTGDLATKEASGELRFLGRKDDVIVTGAGMNVYPPDLEAAMMKQAGLRGCVVVPCETANGVEPIAVVIFVGLDEELQLAVRDANRGLAEYQRIRRVLRWPEAQFPYTSTGKLLRKNVREWACRTISGHQQVGASTSAPSEDVLINLIAQVTGERVTVDTHLDGGDYERLRLEEDLHLDSLGRVQLQSMLEQSLGIEVEDNAIASAETIGELRALVNMHPSVYLAQNIDAGAPVLSSAQPPETEKEISRSNSGLSEEQKAHGLRDVYPHWPWSWPASAARIVFIEFILRPLVWILAAPRVKLETRELPRGPLLVIANHVTAYDAALILYALPWRLRQHMAIAMSGEMLLDFRRGQNQQSSIRNLLAPAAYWLVTALFNVYPLPRLHGFRRSFSHAGEAMDRGYAVMVFPEGTRSRNGKLQPFRPGIGLLAKESRVPILPVALIGLGTYGAKKARWFRSEQLEVHIGEPIPFNEAAEPPDLTAIFQERVRQLQT
jgi:long-chain acyl-CoA synthetase